MGLEAMSDGLAELARIIRREYVGAVDRKRISDVFTAPAAAIIAAGYQKPRIITSLDELDALQEGTVIRDSNKSFPHVYECQGQWGEPYGTYFYHTGSDLCSYSWEVVLPATVLYEAEASK